jgi:ABC-2 type transport system permease protein
MEQAVKAAVNYLEYSSFSQSELVEQLHSAATTDELTFSNGTPPDIRTDVTFFDNGIPVEYELVRSIGTVTAQKKYKLGVLNTDAQLFGGIQQGMMGGFSQIPRQTILDELEKFYEVIEINPSETIDPADYDVLLAVQPSSLTPPQMNNLIAAIRSGLPTAICDDPMPVALNQAPPISQDKRGQQFMGQGAPPAQKGDIRQLWDMLGVRMVGEKLPTNPHYNAFIVWQDYNPERRFQGLQNVTPEWVFIDRNLPGPRALDQPAPINLDLALTQDLQQLLFLFPGAIQRTPNFPKSLQFTPLITTATQPQMIGTVALDELTRAYSGNRLQPPRRQHAPMDEGRAEPYVLAALIEGSLDGTDATAVNVAMVGDIDLFHNDFVQLRAQNVDGVPLAIDNTNFLLNLLDHLAGEQRFIPIRSRSAPLARLSLMDELTKNSRQQSAEAIEAATEQAKQVEEELRDELEAPIDELNKKIVQLQERARMGQEISEQDIQEIQQRNLELNQRQTAAQKRMEVAQEKLKAKLDQDQERINRELNRKVLYLQNRVKMMAVTLPPIPPILIGIIVFVIRRLKEREGLSKDRIVK